MASSGDAIYSGLIARGFNPAQAAALAGNIEQESSFDPNSTNAASGAYGLLNWRGPRLAALQAYAKSTGRAASDPDAQLDYLVTEMQGPEAKNAAAFLGSGDVTAANDALAPYIRYGAKESGNRLQYAQDFAAKPHGATSAPDAAGDDLLSKYLGPAPAASAGPVAAAPAAADDSDALLQKYLGPQAIDTGNPMVRGAPKPAVAPQSLSDELSAGFSAGVNAIPIAGPAVLGALESIKGAVQGRTPEDVAATDKAQVAANPVAAGIGTVAGTVLPLAVAPESALLGTSGDAAIFGSNLAARIAGGAGSSAVLEGADTLARGGSVEQARSNALLAAGLGGAAPVALKGLGAAWQAFKGPAAETTLANALTADQVAPGQVNQLLGKMGPDATIADLGPNAQQLAGSLASLPGKPKTIVMNNLLNRAEGAGDRLQQSVADNLGTGAPIQQQIDSLSAKQSAAATPLYDAVRDVQVNHTPALVNLMQRPAMQAALNKAATLAANDGYQAKGLSVGLLDYAKRALDDTADEALRAGKNNEARQATSLASTLKSEVDAQVPGYAAARDAFAGPAKVKDAISAGQDVFSAKTSPEQMQSTLAGMSTSERDGLLLGAQSAVQSLIGNAKNDAQGVKSAFASNFAQQKLALLIGPDAAQAVADAIDREGTYAATKNTAMGNSLTAARQAGQKAVSPETMAIPTTKGATWTGLILSGLEKARNALTSAYRANQNVKLANMLTTPGPTGGASVARLAAAAGPQNSLIAPAVVPLLGQDVPANSNSLLAGVLPRKPLQITVNGGNALLAPAQ